MPTNKSQVSKCCGASKYRDVYGDTMQDLCSSCAEPFIPEADPQIKGKYTPEDQANKFTPQQEEKCCEKCYDVLINKDTACINSSCKCHSPQTESGEKCNCGFGMMRHKIGCNYANEVIENLIDSQSPNSGEKCKFCNRDHNKDMACREYINSIAYIPSPTEDWEELGKLCAYLNKHDGTPHAGISPFMVKALKSFISQLITSTRLAEREETIKFISRDQGWEDTEFYYRVKLLGEKRTLEEFKRDLQDNSNK